MPTLYTIQRPSSSPAARRPRAVFARLYHTRAPLQVFAVPRHDVPCIGEIAPNTLFHGVAAGAWVRLLGGGYVRYGEPMREVR